MAEFDPTTPNDAAEAAYREALLGDDAGREQRRARLMAALPRPDVAAAVPVAENALAWRWQPYALGLLMMGLLVAAVLVLKGRNTEPRPEADPRLAAAAPASTAAVVVAQASPAVEPQPAPAAEVPRTMAKASLAKPRAERSAPAMMADATPPRLQRQAEVSAGTAQPEPPVMQSPPAEPVMAAAPPPAAPAVAAAPLPPRAVADASSQAEMLARSEAVSSGVAARFRAAPQMAQSLAASDVAESAKATMPANAFLLAAADHADLATARSALKAGASVHLRDNQGRTVLMLAARTGSREMVNLLLAAGARKADRDPQGWTAADHADAQGHGDLMHVLR
ncbi:ankyrin repeat domain-containing protein [Roseateles sp. P5_E11]